MDNIAKYLSGIGSTRGRFIFIPGTTPALALDIVAPHHVNLAANLFEEGKNRPTFWAAHFEISRDEQAVTIRFFGKSNTYGRPTQEAFQQIAHHVQQLLSKISVSSEASSAPEESLVIIGSTELPAKP